MHQQFPWRALSAATLPVVGGCRCLMDHPPTPPPTTHPPGRVGVGRRPAHPHPPARGRRTAGDLRAGRPTRRPAPAASPTTRLGARDLHVPAAVLRRIEQEGLPPEPEGSVVA